MENYSDVSVAFVNHSLGFADMVYMAARRHIGNRQIRVMDMHTTQPVRDAVPDLTGCLTPYKMDWRVWSDV